MSETILLVVLILLAVVNLVALALLGRRVGEGKSEARLDELGRVLERTERETREALGQMRQESMAEARASREELAGRIRDLESSTGEHLRKAAAAQEERLDSIVNTVTTIGQGPATSRRGRSIGSPRPCSCA